MPNNPFVKKTARAYAAEHGVAYVEALRIVTAQHAAKSDTSTCDGIRNLDCPTREAWADGCAHGPGPLAGAASPEVGTAAPRPVQIHRDEDGTLWASSIPLIWDGTPASAQAMINIAARHDIQVAWMSASDESPATLHVYEPDGLRTVLPGGIVLTVEQMTPRPPHPALAQFADVTVGDRIRFAPQPGRGWWTVKARSDRFVLAVQQAPFQPKGDLWYTVVDLTGWTSRYNGVGPGVVRSSLNTLGGGWDLGEDGEGCVDALAGLESGKWSLSRRRVMAVDGIEVAPSRWRAESGRGRAAHLGTMTIQKRPDDLFDNRSEQPTHGAAEMDAPPLGHWFVGVEGHPDDDECTYRGDSTDATYCGRREYEHEPDPDACPTCLLVPEEPDEPIQPGDYYTVDPTSPSRCPSCGLVPARDSEGARRVAAAARLTSPEEGQS